MDADMAIVFVQSHDNMACLMSVHKELQANGLMKEARAINFAIETERRRMRGLAREDEDVALALKSCKGRANEQECAVRHSAQAEHREAETAKRLKADIAGAEKTLRKKKAAVAALEDILETKYAMKAFTPELLGQGQKKAGGAKAQKVRLDVLERLAHLGAGLTPAQRNDWTWFKTAWDAKMFSEHDHEWPALFAGRMQQVLEELAQEAGSKAFSRFMHQETLRCLSDQDALHISAAGVNSMR